MIHMTLQQLAASKSGAVSGAARIDEATAEGDGVLHTAQTAHGATMALARKLVAAGCPNQSWEACNPEGKRVVFGPNLHSLATWTLTEGSSTSLKMVAYAPRPAFEEGAA